MFGWFRRLFSKDPVGVWIPMEIERREVLVLEEEKRLRELFRLLVNQKKLLADIDPEEEKKFEHTQVQWKASLVKSIDRLESEIRILLRKVHKNEKDIEKAWARFENEEKRKRAIEERKSIGRNLDVAA